MIYWCCLHSGGLLLRCVIYLLIVLSMFLCGHALARDFVMVWVALIDASNG